MVDQRHPAVREPEVNLNEPARRAFGGVQKDARRDAAAGDPAVDRVANPRFEHLQIPRQIERDLALFAVHGTEFNGHLEPLPGAFAPPASRH